jgi:protoheme IX farnesyltransferase
VLKWLFEEVGDLLSRLFVGVNHNLRALFASPLPQVLCQPSPLLYSTRFRWGNYFNLLAEFRLSIKMVSSPIAALPNPSRPTLKAKLRDYYTLTKPEVNLLILMTTSAGYYLGTRGSLNLAGLLNTLLGTLLVASGTATLNQWMERVWDGKMRRTASRPLPSGRLSTREAFWFGSILSTVGGLYLAVMINPLAALLATSTLLSYLLVYTPLKRVTPLCTLLGAVPGAMPTLIGWGAAAGHIDRAAWFLFAILFLWQFPHFLAIALMYQEDYDREGYRMLPSFDVESRFTRSEILGFTVVLVLTTLLPSIHAGLLYLVAMLLAGAFLLYHVIRLTRSASKTLASRVVHASVIYLPLVLLIIAWKR